MTDLLKQRIKQFKIPQGALDGQAVFLRVHVWQIADGDNGESEDEKFFKGTNILKPQAVQSNDRARAPRGVLISAGLEAMDFLVSNGMQLGDIVWFTRVSPWRRPVDGDGVKTTEIVILYASDIIASETLAERIRNGAKYAQAKDGGHEFIDADGKSWARKDPAIEHDY